jgi:hypothetical protein
MNGNETIRDSKAGIEISKIMIRAMVEIETREIILEITTDTIDNIEMETIIMETRTTEMMKEKFQGAETAP